MEAAMVSCGGVGPRKVHFNRTSYKGGWAAEATLF